MAPSCSQRQRSSISTSNDDDTAAAASSSSSSLSAFATLPHELRSYIVELACILPPSASKSAATTRHKTKVNVPFDPSTALSLLTVSEYFYNLVVPVLYGSVLLPRPSTLESLLRAISERPQLGKLVKSLRVGDVEQLPARWLPFEASNPPLPTGGWAITSSLRSVEEVKLLPRGFESGQQWPVAAAANLDRRSKAAHDALIAIQRCLDVDLTREKRGQADMHTPEWIIHMYEAQAAFDLYLMAMRRWEVVGCSTYPPLYITGYPCNARTGPPPQTYAGLYVFDRADILRHVARPRALTDRFEHHLVFARSGIDVVRSSFGFPQDENKTTQAAKLRPSLPRTASVELINSLLVDLLSRTPQLKALSVSVYLEGAMYHAPATALSNLRYLSVGHRGFGWSKPLDLTRLAGLEHLQTRKMVLQLRQIEQMIVALPRLKRLTMDWRMPKGPLSEIEFLWVQQVVERFMDRGSATPAAQAGLKGEGEGGGSSNRGSVTSMKDTKPLTIEILLHCKDLEALLRKRSKAERSAWTKGHLLPGQRCRLLLLESRESEESRWWMD